MAKVYLENMIGDIKFEDLPANWTSFDLSKFSKDKELWDYQQQAVINAIKALWKYYEDFREYQIRESLEVNQERKQELLRWYQDNGLEQDLSLKVDKRKRDIYSILTEYYPEVDDKISYEHFINRMCFWMATGSGKTLVIIKLIQVLKRLIELGEVPAYDMLILTYRDDLITQLKRHIDEFNYANTEIHIDLKELKDYANVKNQRVLFKDTDITVFYYRSDNLSDEQKEKIIDFKNYDNDGKWFVFLDEAHKGDKEESKRQHIYSILSRNGFLFNSSATFADPRDVVTTVCNFNLERFINSGYGKHISIMQQEIRAFRSHEDYSGEEKQKIVLKSLISLTYVKKAYEQIRKTRSNLYHNPLLLTLVNSVSKEDADLKLFFREIEKIGKGLVEESLFESALNELWGELKLEPEFIFESGEKITTDEAIFKAINREDILNYVYNSYTSGEIEILIRPSNRQELAFKLKTSDKPFALVKIGDISGWLKEGLSGYEINEKFEDESFFENLNNDESDINILMGSRSFYEGWDSNRPNVMNYINIGTGQDAVKFILQSVGRGVRIEPVKNKRKRLLSLYNANEIDKVLFDAIKTTVQPIETLLIFGTNRYALQTVIEQLKKTREGEKEISLFVNPESMDFDLLVPAYRLVDTPTLRHQSKFPVSDKEFNLLADFFEYVPDDRTLLMRYNTDPAGTELLRRKLSKRSSFGTGSKEYGNADLLIQRIFDYFNVIPEEVECIKGLEDEIKHFRNIKVYLEDIKEIQRKIERVKDYPVEKQKLKEQFDKMTPDEVLEKAQKLKGEESFEFHQKRLRIKYIANHYYLPLILSDNEKVDYISHIIKTPSEVRFIDDLEHYLDKDSNKFKQFDQWLFSKIDETLDDVYIPYYNPNNNRISYFYPDFIFWLRKATDYHIIFVDPKGTEHVNAYRKIGGYRELFEKDDEERTFNHNGFKVTIGLLLVPDDISKTLPEYQKYWLEDFDSMFLEKSH